MSNKALEKVDELLAAGVSFEVAAAHLAPRTSVETFKRRYEIAKRRVESYDLMNAAARFAIDERSRVRVNDKEHLSSTRADYRNHIYDTPRLRLVGA